MQYKQYDVVVLGAGIAGTMMAAILARHGLTVLMIDKTSHPRFAVGESTVGHTSAMLQLIADRYDVPEIDHLSSFSKVRKHISQACGVKRAFGFVYHRQDGSQHPEEANQFVIPPHLHGLENHLYRQDTDAYMFQVAVSYGAEFLMDVTISNIEFSDREVTISTDKIPQITTQYVIDATGFRSVIAQKLNLRCDPDTLETRTRSLFTHMCQVKPYDECIRPNYHQMPIPWFQSTLHHVFSGGWIWVIPFNNTKNATNPLCSVGVTVDIDHFPSHGLTPEKEFYEIIERFPSVKTQFASAKPVRNWVSTGRLQYTSKNTIGDRYCLMGHAAGFIDPLFSRGLAITMDTVFHLGVRILDAFKNNEFKAENFKFVDEIARGGVYYHDQLVATSYRSWQDYKLWNAWSRIWALGEAGLDQLRILKAHVKYLKNSDNTFLEQLENISHPGLLCPDSEVFARLFAQSKQLIDQAYAYEISVDDASAKIYQLINEAELISPEIGVGTPDVRNFGHSQIGNMQSFLWGKWKAKEHIKKYYDIDSLDLIKLFMKNIPEFFHPDLQLHFEAKS